MELLRVEKLSKSFGGLQAVKNVSLSLMKGEILGLIGPNGAGKSTTFNMLNSYIQPSSGKVFLKGIEVTKEKPHKIAIMGLGRTFQHVKLFMESTVLDNVLMASYCRISPSFWNTIWKSFKSPKILSREVEKAKKTLEFVGLKGYENEIAANLDHGSQGMLQIAIALASDPEVVLLDEPLRGMNPTETNEICRLIRSLKESGIGILIIEHDMKAIMSLCDRIIVLENGEKLAQGTPKEVQTNQKVIEAYLGGEVIA